MPRRTRPSAVLLGLTLGLLYGLPQAQASASVQDVERAQAPPGGTTRLQRVVPLAGGRLLALERARGDAAAELLLLGTDGAPPERVTAGGALHTPADAIVLDEDTLLVADRQATGHGAILRVDLASGRQDLVAYGVFRGEPRALVLTPGRRLFVFDGGLVELDPESGAVLGRIEPFLEVEASYTLAVHASGALVLEGRRGNERRAFLLRPDAPAGSDVWPLPAPTTTSTLRNAPDLAHLGQSARPDSTGAAAADGVTITPSPRAPAIEPVPEEDTIRLVAGLVWIPGGPGIADDQVLPGGEYPLAVALRSATPGSNPVIGVYDSVPGVGVSIGGGDVGLKDYVVHWGKVPMRFTVVGRSPTARLREFDLRMRMNDGALNGGVLDARFEKLTIEARFNACVSVPKGQEVGLLRFYDCHFAASREGLAEGAHNQFGYKWGVRGHGRARWDFRRCSFDPVEEHCIYIDSPQGDCYFVDIEHRGSRRTAIQVVNRSIDNPGASGYGTLLFEKVHVFDLWGDGGSGITVSGHLGPVWFRDIVARENPLHGGSHGGLVVWTDADLEKGTYLFTGEDGGLYSCPSVTLESVDVDMPNADRPHVAFSGVEKVLIRDFRIAGNRAALAFDSLFGAPTISGPAVVDGQWADLDGVRIHNGKVQFAPPCPVSTHPGFQTPVAVQMNGTSLSDVQIDNLFCNAP